MSEYVTKRVDALRVDYPLVALLALTVVFQVGALWVADYVSLDTATPTQTMKLSIGLRLAGIVIVESLLIVGLWRLYKHLGDFTQKLIQYFIVGTAALTLALVVYEQHGLTRVVINAAIGVALYVTIKRTSSTGLAWVVFNLVAIGGGMVITGVMGVLVGPPVVILIMLLMLAWDKLAVDLSNLMGDLVDFSASVSIPNFVIIPKQLRFELAPIREFITDPETNDRPDSVALIIGVGDFLFPALLTASALVAYTDMWPVYGAFAGTLVATVLLSAELHVREGGAPALPWVNTGAIGGFAVGMVPVVL